MQLILLAGLPQLFDALTIRARVGHNSAKTERYLPHRYISNNDMYLFEISK